MRCLSLELVLPMRVVDLRVVVLRGKCPEGYLYLGVIGRGVVFLKGHTHWAPLYTDRWAMAVAGRSVACEISNRLDMSCPSTSCPAIAVAWRWSALELALELVVAVRF